jgi:hypothetical protein
LADGDNGTKQNNGHCPGFPFTHADRAVST